MGQIMPYAVLKPDNQNLFGSELAYMVSRA